MIVLVRNLPQLEAALKCGVTTVYCEFEDPKKYREAVTLFHTAHGCRNPQSAIGNPQFSSLPRAFSKPGEEWILEQVRSCNADGYLVRNYDHLKFFANDRRVGDYSLNVANRLAADYFKNQFGLERVTRELRFEFSAARSAVARRAAGMVRGDDPPAHADVSHGALRVLRVSFQRHGFPELRPARATCTT